MNLRSALARAVIAVAVTGASILGMAQPASAFSASSSINISGNTYTAAAWSCNLYVTSCSWDSTASSTYTRTFTHYADVKANGINVTVTISTSPSMTITGNSTTLATARRTVTTTRDYFSGVARPSIFSVSVAARTRLVNSAVSLNSGWTTW